MPGIGDPYSEVCGATAQTVPSFDTANGTPRRTQDHEALADDEPVIPKIFHRIWLGDDAIPAQFESYWAGWRRHHPGWDLVTWTERTLPLLRNQAEFARAESYAQRSDIARYEILERFGGVYVDTDFECLRPIDDLLDHVDGFAGMEDEAFLCNAILGFCPGHPFLRQVISLLPSSIASQPGLPPNHQTGPWLITRVWRAAGTLFQPPLFMAYGTHLLYPYHSTEPHRAHDDFPEAYAVHHWAQSWLTTTPHALGDEPARVLVELNLDQPAPDPVVATFGRLFRRGDPIELALPVSPNANIPGAVAAVEEVIRSSGVDPAKAARIVLYSAAEADLLRVDAAVTLLDRKRSELAAVDLLHSVRALLDGSGDLEQSAAPIAPTKRTTPSAASSAFWEGIYAAGATSGSGSYGRLAAFKAEVINSVLQEHSVTSAIEFGCGDGHQLGLIAYPRYFGLDVSPTAVERCRSHYRDDPTKTFFLLPPLDSTEVPRADLAVSLDVIYHLLEDAVFDRYMQRLFAAATRLVLVYSSDFDGSAPWPEVRHRTFTRWVNEHAPEWRLVSTIENRFPWDPTRPTDTSWADFYLFELQ